MPIVQAQRNDQLQSLRNELDELRHRSYLSQRREGGLPPDCESASPSGESSIARKALKGI